MTCEGEAASLGSKKVAQVRVDCYKKYSEPRRVKNLSTKNCLCKDHLLPVIVYLQMIMRMTTYTILIQITYQICFDKKDKNMQCESDNKSHMQLLLCEVTQKLTVNKKRISNSREHKVLLIGDRHLRGCAAYMKVFFYGYVKSGASSKFVMETAQSDIRKLTMDDF
jgi:hypothetical protein